MGERRHPNAKLDDGTWRALLGRWHAGEAAAALRGEAGVSRDTWRANAARLGMRLKDLPPDHPARRRAPPHAERPDDWKHPLGALTEGRWRALFALRARGAPDVVLASQFGVAPASICWQAKRRGLARPGAVVGAADGPAVGAGPGEGPIETLGVRIDPGDRAGALAGFDAAIATAAAAADFARVVLLCQARGAVDRAMFGGGRASVGAAPAPSSPGDDVPPPEGGVIYLTKQRPRIPCWTRETKP